MRRSPQGPRLLERRALTDEATANIRRAREQLGYGALIARLGCSRTVLQDVLEPNGVFRPETATKLEQKAREL